LRIPTVRVRNVAAIPEVLAELGADLSVVTARVGLEPATFSNLDNVISYAALGRLAAAAVEATGCESFGLRVGMKTRPSGIGLSGLVSIHSPTVREGLEVITATLRTSDTGGATFLETRRGVASFGYAVTAPDVEGTDQIVDGATAIAFNLMRRLCGPTWRPDAVHLTREPPRDKALFTRFFQAKVEFGGKAGRLVFDAGVLDQPTHDRDPHVTGVLAPLLQEAADEAQGDFLSTARAVIRTQLAAGALSRDSVCRALSLSPRTLVHRLEARGLTYSGLADEAKFEAAQSLLRKGHSIAETAARLGFADPSAFTRAFKAWSGTTPARWRSARAR
jgi:AraC-like DNA-binding protein